MDEMELSLIASADETTRSKFIGVYAADELDRLDQLTAPSFLISNTSNRKDIGSHWTVIFIPKAGEWEYFDSLAKPPGKYLAEFLRRGSESYLCCADRIQSEVSLSCGLYSLEYARSRCLGIPFSTFMKKFDAVDLDRNEELIKTRWCAISRNYVPGVCLI